MENHTSQNNGDSDMNKFVGGPRMSSMWSYPPRPYENYPHYRNHYPEQQQVNMQPQYQEQPQQQYSQPQQFQQQPSPQQQQQQQLQQIQQQMQQAPSQQQQIQQSQQIQPQIQQQPVQQIQHVQVQQPQQPLVQKLPAPVSQQQPSMPQIQVVSAQPSVTNPPVAQSPQVVQPAVQQSSTAVTTVSEPAVTTSPISVSTTSHAAVINSSTVVGTTLQTALTSGLSQSQTSTKTSSATSQLMNSQHQQSIEHPTKILTRNRLQDLVREVDPNEQLDEDVEDILLQIADDFVENAITNACLLAKHRKSNTVEVKDLQLHLERNWNMWIPGFGTDELRPYKKSSTTEAHKQRQTLIKKHTRKS